MVRNNDSSDVSMVLDGNPAETELFGGENSKSSPIDIRSVLHILDPVDGEHRLHNQASFDSKLPLEKQAL